jgi:hypothetical protein
MGFPLRPVCSIPPCSRFHRSFVLLYCGE